MQTFTISVTVPSERAALAIVDICRACYSSARLVRLGLLGGFIHEASAVIECTAENERERRAAWSAFVDRMHRAGYGRMIY